MTTYAPDDLDEITHQWSALDSDFSDFTKARGLDGTWKMLAQARLPPDIPPELVQYVQGGYSMFGGLDDDIRNLISIHLMNPTRFGVHAAGNNETSKKIESTWKLAMANWWLEDLNNGRELDSYNYEGQVGLGLAVNWIRWKQRPKDKGVSGCPMYVEKVLAECIRYKGDPRNPSAAWCKYSVSAVDCDIKNGKGERPAYKTGTEDLGWVSEGLPPDFYKTNAGKQIDVIVRDAEDPVAMCPLDGCDHRKRRVTIYVCKKGGEPRDYEEVESYDSPFEKCSFILCGADLRQTERDPHRIFRPSAWVLYAIIMEYNSAVTRLKAMARRELSDDTSYINAGQTGSDTLSALTVGAEGGNRVTVERPEQGQRDIAAMPGPVLKFPGPALDGLLQELKMLRDDYRERRAWIQNLTGQMTTSEVSATVGQLQVQGSGIPIGPDLARYDVTINRFFKEIRHGIRFTGYYEPDGAKTRYMVSVSGKSLGSVYGQRQSGAGEVIYLDAKLCEHDVIFSAETSKDTPSETAQRRMQAITALHEGIYVMEDVDEAWDIYDHEAQQEKRAAEFIDETIQPMETRAIVAVTVGRFSRETGIDFGTTLQTSDLEMPQTGSSQTHNTQAANAATTVAPTVQPAPLGTPAGGSGGLA